MREHAVLLLLVLITACTPTRDASTNCAANLADTDCRVITARDYRVLRVVDGDTFKIEYDGVVTSVRLALVDAPERDELGGPDATVARRQLLDGKVVVIAFTDAIGRAGWGSKLQV